MPPDPQARLPPHRQRVDGWAALATVCAAVPGQVGEAQLQAMAGLLQVRLTHCLGRGAVVGA